MADAEVPYAPSKSQQYVTTQVPPTLHGKLNIISRYSGPFTVKLTGRSNGVDEIKGLALRFINGPARIDVNSMEEISYTYPAESPETYLSATLRPRSRGSSLVVYSDIEVGTQRYTGSHYAKISVHPGVEIRIEFPEPFKISG
ncbi:MAG: hypothetical protein HYW24_04620 [Candidatus Aenigmarchaeota archaeon]|nr:hypothetical protein [Candidatus Aenigmarchaeota archaeon]